MNSYMTPENIRKQFLAIIDERLNHPTEGLLQEHERLRVGPKTAHNIRRLDWISKTIDTNLRFKDRLELGRFAVR